MNTRSPLFNGALAVLLGGASWALSAWVNAPGEWHAARKSQKAEGGPSSSPADGRTGGGGTRAEGRAGGSPETADAEKPVGTDPLFAAHRRLAERLAKTDPMNLAYVLNDLNEIADTVERRTVREMLFLKMAKHDPARWLAMMQRSYKDQIPNFLRAWGITDPAAAEKWAAAQTEASGMQTHAVALLSDMARSNPERAREALMNPKVTVSSDGVWAAVGDLASRDPEAARKLIDAQTSPWRKGHSVFGLTWSLARKDPQAAVAYAEAQSDPVLRASALNGLLHTLGRTDPARAAKLWEENKDILLKPHYGLHATRAIIDGLASKNWQDGVAFIRSVAKENDYDYYTRYAVLPHMADAGIADLAALADDMPQAAGAMEFPDVKKSFTEAAALPDSEGKKVLLGMLARRMAEMNPVDALAKARAAGQGALDALGDAAAESMISTARPAEFGAAVAHLDKEEHSGYYARMASSLGETAPHLLKEFVGGAPPGPAQAWAAYETAGAWTKYHPATAVEWVETRPDQEKPALMYTVAMNWASQDPWETSQWVSRIPEGDQRDAAVYGLAGALSDSEPESALAWAGTISDEKRRQEVVSRAIMSWHGMDPQAAARALHTANLPDEARMALAEYFRTEQ